MFLINQKTKQVEPDSTVATLSEVASKSCKPSTQSDPTPKTVELRNTHSLSCCSWVARLPGLEQF